MNNFKNIKFMLEMNIDLIPVQKVLIYLVETIKIARSKVVQKI